MYVGGLKRSQTIMTQMSRVRDMYFVSIKVV